MADLLADLALLWAGRHGRLGGESTVIVGDGRINRLQKRCEACKVRRLRLGSNNTFSKYRLAISGLIAVLLFRIKRLSIDPNRF